MSGAEVLAIVGGVAAFAGLLKNAKDTISWIRLGPSGELLFMKSVQWNSAVSYFLNSCFVA